MMTPTGTSGPTRRQPLRPPGRTRSRTSGTTAWGLVALLAAVAPPALAQTPAPGQAPLTLTLEEAVARGLAEAPRLAGARALEAAADATVGARTALGRPTVTASSGLLRTNHVDEFGIPQPDGSFRVIFPDIPDNYRARAELDVPVYTGGRVDALVASARAGQQAAEADRLTTTADVRLDVVTAYWRLVTTRARVGVLERALQRADAEVSDVQARVDTGILPPNDLLSAQAQRARQNVQLIQARSDASLAEADLGRLVGADPGQPINPATPVDRPTPGAAELAARSAAELDADATRARPERRALLARENALRAAASASIAATRPQVAAVAAVEPARPNPRFVPRADRWNTSWDLGVNVTWSLWDGGRARAERASTSAQADAIGARVRDFDAAVAVDVRRRLLDIESARAALAASADAVAAAREARRVLGERFDVGVATSSDVLASDVALLSAELEHTNLQAALRLAESRLLRTVGGR